MAKDEKELVDLIVKYAAHKGGAKGTWYVGVSKDPQKKLFKVHGVDKQNDSWIFDHAVDTVEAARIIDKLLMMGFDGEALHEPDGTGIYVYQKKEHTKE
jgi:hypothetical protein